MVTSKEDRKEDGYMKHFISDHTPMDDYQGILQQAYYTKSSVIVGGNSVFNLGEHACHPK